MRCTVLALSVQVCPNRLALPLGPHSVGRTDVALRADQHAGEQGDVGAQQHDRRERCGRVDVPRVLDRCPDRESARWSVQATMSRTHLAGTGYGVCQARNGIEWAYHA